MTPEQKQQARDRAQKFLTQYLKDTKPDEDPDDFNELFELMADMIHDILTLADGMGMDFEYLLRLSLKRYTLEG